MKEVLVRHDFEYVGEVPGKVVAMTTFLGMPVLIIEGAPPCLVQRLPNGKNHVVFLDGGDAEIAPVTLPMGQRR